MELGFTIDPFHPDSIPPRQAGEAVLEGAVRAQREGLDYVQCPAHHVSGDRKFLQAIPTAARLGAVFDHVAVMCLLPLHDPVQLTERLGTLGCFVDDLDLWCAVGGHEAAFEAFGVPMAERGRRFDEHLSVIQQLCDGDPVTVDGEFVTLEDVVVNPRPDPRICIGGIAEPAVRRAGRRGDAWVVSAREGDADIERKLEWFEAAGGGDVLVRRDVLVREDADEASEALDAVLAAGYRGWDRAAAEERILCGGVDDVVDRFEAYETLGIDEVVISPVRASETAETLRLVAEARDRL